MRNVVNFQPTTRKSKNFTSMGSFCPKKYKVGAKKNTEEISYISEELCVMTLKGDAKFKGKLIRGLKNEVRNLIWLIFM